MALHHDGVDPKHVARGAGRQEQHNRPGGIRTYGNHGGIASTVRRKSKIGRAPRATIPNGCTHLQPVSHPGCVRISVERKQVLARCQRDVPPGGIVGRAEHQPRIRWRPPLHSVAIAAGRCSIQHRGNRHRRAQRERRCGRAGQPRVGVNQQVATAAPDCPHGTLQLGHCGTLGIERVALLSNGRPQRLQGTVVRLASHGVTQLGQLVALTGQPLLRLGNTTIKRLGRGSLGIVLAGTLARRRRRHEHIRCITGANT
ncbi:hypothetical protein D3C77_303990 [compost metagenome]